MVPIKLADQIEISAVPGHGISLVCNDPDLPLGSDNLCVKAVESFREETGISHGVAISLMKRIPHGAGLGGGSSDAAAVLKGMNEIFDRPLVAEELQQLAASLGSDVPFFLHDGAAWCRGRGEILEDAAALPRRILLLIKPPFPVPTAWAYKRYAEMKASEAGMPPRESQWLGDLEITNDLEDPVFGKYLLLPVIKEWLRGHPEVESAFMTGSGSTIVAVVKPGTSSPVLTALEGAIRAEFGNTIWICVTGWE